MPWGMLHQPHEQGPYGVSIYAERKHNENDDDMTDTRLPTGAAMRDRLAGLSPDAVPPAELGLCRLPPNPFRHDAPQFHVLMALPPEVLGGTCTEQLARVALKAMLGPRPRVARIAPAPSAPAPHTSGRGLPCL